MGFANVDLKVFAWFLRAENRAWRAVAWMAIHEFVSNLTATTVNGATAKDDAQHRR